MHSFRKWNSANSFTGFLFLFVGALNLPASNVKTMAELPAASVHQDSSEADLVQLLDAWSQGWKCKGRVRAVGPGAYEKYCTLGLYAHGGVSGITQASMMKMPAELSIISSSPDFRTRPGRPLRFFATLGWGFIVI